MLGYYRNPEETEKVMDNGWFYTGDYGYFNKKGQLVVSGRKKNIIVLNNGKNVYPEEIENYIQGIDFIQDVVVSGNVNDKGDEDSLVAEVYLSEIKSSQEVLNAIRNACRPLPNYKQVSKVVVREEEFEKTTTNKIKRNQSKKK
jgi:long-chain acyl-CoA synthetase